MARPKGLRSATEYNRRCIVCSASLPLPLAAAAWSAAAALRSARGVAAVDQISCRTHARAANPQPTDTRPKSRRLVVGCASIDSCCMCKLGLQARTLGGDEGGLVGAEERDQARNLVRLPEPAQGVAGRERSIELRVGLKPGRQPRFDEPRACTPQTTSGDLLGTVAAQESGTQNENNAATE